MTYRELPMIDVRELLRRRAAGQSMRKVARETRIDRKTVERYMKAAQKLGLALDAELTDAVVHDVAHGVQARATIDPSEERLEVARHRVRIEAWLAAKRPLKLTKIHTLLARDYGVRASYDTLRRFAIDELGWRRKKATVLVADGKPGEEVQVDFGLMGVVAATPTRVLPRVLRRPHPRAHGHGLHAGDGGNLV